MDIIKPKNNNNEDVAIDSNYIVDNETILSTILSTLTIDSYSLAENGYIRFKNGFQIAWKQVSVTAGGSLWNTTYPIYYSTHSMGNWSIAFSELYACFCSCKSVQYWSSLENASATSAGNVRCFRPNDATDTISVYVVGIGSWK